MKKDDVLEQYFTDFHPELEMNDEFMAQLQEKMDKMEPAKQFIQSERKQFRAKLVIALFSGFISGGFMSLLLILHPIRLGLLRLHLPEYMNDSLIYGLQNSLSVVIVLAVALVVGYICMEYYSLLTHKSHTEDNKHPQTQ